MKLQIIGCLTGSAAAIFFSGCAADPYATTTTYRGGYYSDYDTDSELVTGSTAYVDSTAVTSPYYGTSYAYGGRRIGYGYPGVRRAAGARIIADQRYSSARYRDWDRGDLGRRDWDRGDLGRRDWDRGDLGRRTWGGTARRMDRRGRF